MVKVCDSVMGSFKTTAAINYINEHPDTSFIYITPFLEEAERISEGCPDAGFIEPSNKLSEYHYRKSEHTAALIKQGCNIATTHQAFKMYTEDMLCDIHSHGYTLFIDENVEMLESMDYCAEDLHMLEAAGYLKNINGVYSMTGKEYGGNVCRDFFSKIGCRNTIEITATGTDRVYYWKLQPELIMSFRNVFILTYLFDCQSIHHMLQMNDIEYTYIGVKNDSGTHHFCEGNGDIPEFIYSLKDKIHILDNEKLNRIGDEKHDLSMSWFDKPTSDIAQMKNNLYNFFRNINSGTDSGKRLWATFNKEYQQLKGKGYANAFLTFNARATNNYRDREVLAYVANIFMNVGEKLFYKTNGVEVDEDAYALSTLIQWIWRSAIRDGKEISLYLPSSRMRELLLDWMDKSAKGVMMYG